MGLSESDQPLIDNESTAIACSICLEIVAVGGDRSMAKLQCGHEFHLDCIGSAFNSKGLMQCPNCRNVEKGKWFYSNGSHSPTELSFDEWAHDEEDLYDLSYSEMSYGVHWCPFSRIARVPSTFEEDESYLAFAFQDLLVYHGNTNTLAADTCPYMAYLQPFQTSSSSNPHISYEIPLANWNQTSGTPDVQINPYSVFNGHASGSSPAIISGVRVDSDGLGRAASFVYPFFLGHGYGSRLAGSFVAASIPPYTVSAQPHYQHHNPLFVGPRRPVATSELPPVGRTPISLPDQTIYYLFPPTTASSSRSLQDTESAGSWQRGQYAPFPLLPVERESAQWGPHPHSSSSSESRFWHHNGSSEQPISQGRMEALSYRPPHAHAMSRTRPYI